MKEEKKSNIATYNGLGLSPMTEPSGEIFAKRKSFIEKKKLNEVYGTFGVNNIIHGLNSKDEPCFGTSYNSSPYYEESALIQCSPGISYIEKDVTYVKSEKEFIEIFGNPNMNFTSTPTPTPMSTDDLKDKIIRDLEQERHTMNDAMREKEFRASYMQDALLYVWHDLCDAYDKKSSIKEVYTHTLHYMYNMLEDHLTNCPDYATRDLTKKIKKEIEQTKIKSKEVFDDF